MISSRSRALSARFLFATSALSLLIATPALARDDKADTAAQAPVAQTDEPQDGEIVVTATRRAEAAKDVPIAVTAIGGEKLDVINSSGLDVRFLAARVPSLQVESSFGRTQPRFYIRGLGNTDFDINAAQPVSVVYDDVALDNSLLKSFPIFDLQGVEVLRGPQGTLFGRNTPAGVVKIDSAKPDATRQSGYATVSVGTFNTVNSEMAVNVPLGSGFALRLSGINQRRDDWVYNDSTSGAADKKLEGYSDVAGRAQLGYSSGDFNAIANFHYRDLQGTPRTFRAGLFRPGSNQFNTGFDPRHVTLDGYTSQSLTQWGTNLRMDYHFDGIGTLYSVTGYEKGKVESTGDVDGGNRYAFIPGNTIGTIGVSLFPSNTGGISRPKEFSQELRFASEDMNGVRLQGGLYYFDQRLEYHQFNYGGPTTSRAADLNQDIFHSNKNENYGAFASVELKPVEALTLRGGLRYSHDYRRDVVAVLISNGGESPIGPVPTVKASNVSWDASATYAFTPSVNVYARVATGYQGPAIQDRITFGSVQTIAPKQTTISGEAGIKGAFGRIFNFALDGYYNRTRDFQITAVGGNSNTARLLSADKVIGYGVEAELEARPTPQLTLTASASYNYTEIQDPSISVGVCATCTVLDPRVTPGGRAIIDGNRLPQAPRYIANWTARYGVPIADGEIYAYTDWAYRSEINFFLYDSVEFRGRAQLEGGLKVAYRAQSGYELGAFVRNITNQYRSISGIDFANLTGMISEPRIIGGTASFRF